MAQRLPSPLKSIARAALATALATALALGLLLTLDGAFPPPLGVGLAYSVEVLDAGGERLRLFTTPGGYWRLPAELGDLDPDFLGMLLTYEDRRFRSHSGVDFLALGRAAWQALRHGRVVSGGSTLSMQTVRLLDPRPRTLGAKLLEMARAWQLERRLDKDAILRLYLDLAPYGGNLQGVRAASLFYFGKEPGFLSLDEAALLVALPQSPERRRPDRFPEAARAARDRVLERLLDAGQIAAADARRAMQQPVPRGRRPTPVLAPHLADRLRQARPGQRLLRTNVDARLQRRLEALIERHQRGQGRGVTLAALVADNRTGEVRAYLGSGDYFGRVFPGQIDMVRAVRSPGSTLKPFIYGLGFDAGVIHPETLIEDRPGPVGGYAPENFDHSYDGEIRVRDALIGSRNVPAVRLLHRLEPAAFAAHLEQAGVRLRLPAQAERPGLPIALGGVGLTLEELTTLYTALGSRGTARPLSLLQDEPRAEPVVLLSAASAWYLTDILGDSGLPDGFAPGGRRVAFKTGTSYGFRDAWAVGYDADHTVGVWVGRPDGGYTPGLSGLTSAAPVMLEVFDLLPGAGIEPLLWERPQQVLLAANSQLPPVLQRFQDAEPRGSRPASTNLGPRIHYPPEGSLVELGGAQTDQVLIEAGGGKLPFHWLVNGRYLTSTEDRRKLSWRPGVGGSVRVTVIDNRGESASVGFSVSGPGM
jgi:penicillin-binding protein 1C